MIKKFIYLINILLFFLISGDVIAQELTINNAGKEKKDKKTFIRAKVKDVVRAKIGAGPNDIGEITPPEANPEGPMSFALGKDGEIYILDQINSRIQVFKDKKRIRTIPLPTETAFSNIELFPDDRIALLDNLIKKAIYILNSEGKVISVISLEGRLISYAPEVIGIYCIREGKFSGIWADMGGRSVRVGSLDGTSITERISIPGKLSINGKRVIRAEKIGDATVVIYRSKEGSFSQWEPEFSIFFNKYVELLELWDDQNGNIYLGVFFEDVNEKGKRIYSNEIIVFSPELKELGRVNLFAQKVPHEIFHPVKVSPDGRIYQMAIDGNRVFLRRYELTE
jgi:hypothetical protein